MPGQNKNRDNSISRRKTQQTGLKFEFQGRYLLGVILTYTLVLIIPAAGYKYWDSNYGPHSRVAFASAVINPVNQNNIPSTVAVPLTEESTIADIEQYQNQEINSEATENTSGNSGAEQFTGGQVAGISTSSNTQQTNSALLFGLPLGYFLIGVGAVVLLVPMAYLFKSNKKE